MTTTATTEGKRKKVCEPKSWMCNVSTYYVYAREYERMLGAFEAEENRNKQQNM